MPKYIDIHCHVNFKTFKEDGDEVIRRALNNDTWLFNVGSQYTTSKRAVEIAYKYPEGVYAVVGLHPIHLEESFHDEDEVGGEGFMSRAEVFDKQKYLELAKDPKVVAIGECGLDYYHMDEKSIEKQKEVFIEQIEFANEVGKPLMLHLRNNPEETSRNVYFDAYELLKKYAKVKSVSHFFAGNVEDMKRFVELGVYISFAGPITYKPNLKIADYEAVIKETPLEMILTDTDSPYVAPVPYRGKRNEPVYVREIVKKIAEIKNLPESDVAKAIFLNAQKLFGI
jgi:TatD DNase family protein